jgi:DNA processing protein
MKKLTLNKTLETKLNRLKIKTAQLFYSGEDPNNFADIPIVAIVGTRKPTPYGKIMTEKIADELARQGVIIVSGLALGVDSLAHSSILKAGGKTIAVLPSGLNNIYPATNRSIADKIIKGQGSLISEYPKDHKPRKVEFLERNRIIAALSDLVVIPEAAGNSGSLNTANHAIQMGIPVAVVPGNVTSPMSSGTNHLLTIGAKAVRGSDDILKLLGLDSKNKQTKLDLLGETPEETLVLQKIALGHTDSVELQVETLLSTTEFQSVVTMLEVQGKIALDPQGKWYLK